MKFRSVIITLFILLSRLTLNAQYYDTGQDPASLKWLQIKTEKFKIIYPKSYGEEGILFARALEKSASQLTTLFPNNKFKIPVIIHNYSVESNGYISWAPKRMEIFPTPEQNALPMSTIDGLAIHEGAHVYQMTSMNVGFSKTMSFVFGEQFLGALSVMLPLWYLEGHAVFAETALTESGRGRTSSFLQEFKAASIDNKKFYTYDMITNGSYGKHVPNHYKSGYQMIAYGLAKNDMQLWNKALDFTGKYPFSLNPVNFSLGANAKLSKKRLYHETFDTLKTLWNKEISEKKSIEYTILNPDKKGEYINYTTPVRVATNKIAVIKESLSKPYSFMVIDTKTKKEKTLHIPGQMRHLSISSGGGKITWVEFKRDPRWENRSYSVIKTLDIVSKKTKTISKKSRYFASALSIDGKFIAAVENSVNNKNYLVIIDSKSGKVLQKIPSPNNAALQMPKWDESGNFIVCIALTNAGEGVLTYSITNTSWETTLEYGRNDIQSALMRNDTLFYIMSVDGTDNIFLKSPDNTIKRLTDSKYGVKDFFVENNKVIFGSYTSQGHNICEILINSSVQEIDEQNRSSSMLIDRFPRFSDAVPEVETKPYMIEPYRKYLNLFRLHSWMPFYVNVDELSFTSANIRPGATIMSQNNLSTLITTAGYEYNENNENVFHAKFDWRGWYPVIESQIDYGDWQKVYSSVKAPPLPSPLGKNFRISNTIKIPLIYNSGRFTQFIQPSGSIEYNNTYIYNGETDKYDLGMTLISGRFYFSNSHRRSLRDIYPKWAQIVDIKYDMIRPLDFNSVSLRTIFYFPGLLPNNSLRLKYEIEERGDSKLAISNRISFPRGYNNIISRQLELFSADYYFPLAYPDINIASLLYVKRLRGSIFGDYAKGKFNVHYYNSRPGVISEDARTDSEIFKSAGFEALADFHVFRLPFMLSSGAQVAWKDFSQQPAITVLLNIELFGMAINRNRF